MMAGAWATGIAHALAALAVGVAIWAVARAERMSSSTAHGDRLALVCIAAGAVGVAISLAVGGLSIPLPPALVALAVGSAWWFGAGPVRRLLVRRIAQRTVAPGSAWLLRLVNRATGLRR